MSDLFGLLSLPLWQQVATLVLATPGLYFGSCVCLGKDMWPAWISSGICAVVVLVFAVWGWYIWRSSSIDDMERARDLWLLSPAVVVCHCIATLVGMGATGLGRLVQTITKDERTFHEPAGRTD